MVLTINTYFSKTKNKTPTLRKSSTIYQIPCTLCDIIQHCLKNKLQTNRQLLLKYNKTIKKIKCAKQKLIKEPRIIVQFKYFSIFAPFFFKHTLKQFVAFTSDH